MDYSDLDAVATKVSMNTNLLTKKLSLLKKTSSSWAVWAVDTLACFLGRCLSLCISKKIRKMFVIHT